MKPGSGIERFCFVAISITAIFGASFLGSIEAQQRGEALPYRYFAPRRDGRRTSVVVTPSIFDRAHHHAGLAQDEPVDDDSDTVIRKIRLMRMGQEEQQRQESSNSAEAPYTIAGPQQQPAVIESTQPAIFGHGGYPAPTMNFFADKKFPAFSPHTQPVPQQFPYHHQQQQQYQLPMHQHSAGFWQPNNDPYANVQQFNHHHNPFRMVKKHVKHNDAPISRSKQKRRKASSNQNGSSGFVRLDTDENSVPVKGSTWPSTPSVTNGPRSVLSSSMKTKDYSYGYTVQSQNTKSHINSASQRTPDGSVKGHYSFVDADGNLHVTEYAAGGKDGYQAKVYTIKNYDPSRRRNEDLAGTNPTLVTPSLRSASKEVSVEQPVRKLHDQQPHQDSATLVTYQSTPVQDLAQPNNPAFQQFRAALDMKTPQQQLVHTEKPLVIDVLRKSAGIHSGEDVNSPDIKTPVMSNKVLKDSSEEDSGEAPSISQANQQLGAITEKVSQPEPVFEEVPRQPPNANPGKMVYKPILTAAGPFSNINGKRRIGSSLGKAPEQHIDLRKKGRRPSDPQAGYRKHGEHHLQQHQQQQVFRPANNRVHSSSLFGTSNNNARVSATPSLLEHPEMQNAVSKNQVPSVIKDSLDVSGASAELPVQACQLPGQKGCSTSTSDEDVGGTPSLIAIHTPPKKPTEMLQRTTLPTVLPDGVVFLVTHTSPDVPRPAFTKQTLPSSTNQQESSVSSTFRTNGVVEKAKDSDEVKNGGLFEDDDAFLSGLIDPRPKTTQVKCASSTKAGSKGKMSTSSHTSPPVTNPWSSISNSFTGFPTFGQRIPAMSTNKPGITRKTSTSEGLKENPSLSASDPLNLLLPSISTHMTEEPAVGVTRKSKTFEASRITDGSKDGRVVEEESIKDQPNLKEILKQQQLLKMKEIKDELKKKYTHFTPNSAEESKNKWPSTTDDEHPPTRDFFRTLGPKVTSTTTGGDVLDLASKLVKKIEAAAEQKILAKLAPTTTTTGWGTEVDSNRFVWGGSASRKPDPATVSATHSTGTPMVKTYQLPMATPEEESESPEVTDASPLTGTTGPSNPTEGFNLGISSAVPSPMLHNSHATFDIPSVNDQAMLSTLRHFTSLPKIPGSSSPAQKSLQSDAETRPSTTDMLTQDLPPVSNRPSFQLQASSMQKTDMMMNEFQKMKELFRTKGLPTRHMPLPSAGVGQPLVMAMSDDQPRQNIMDPSSMLNFGHIQATQMDTAMVPSTENTLLPSTTIAAKQPADPSPLNNGQQDIMTGLSPQSDLLVSTTPPPTELPASARTFPVTGSPVTNPPTPLKPTEDTTTQPAETVMGMETTAKPKSKGRRRKSKRGKKPQTEPVGEGTTAADLKPDSGKEQGATTPGQQAPAITDMASLMKNLMAATLPPVTAPPASPSEATSSPRTTSLASTTTSSKQEEGITAAAAAGGVPLMPSGPPADGNQPAVVADKPAKKKSRKRSRKNKQKGVTQPQVESLPATAPSAAGATNLVPASSPAALTGQVTGASNAASPQEAASVKSPAALANTASASIGAMPSSLNSASAVPPNKMSVGEVPTKS